MKIYKKKFMYLNNKIFLITGSNGCIGREICKKLIKNGANVIGTDIIEDKLKNKNYFFKADLNDEKERSLLIKKIKNKFKKIDVLVNNAAYVGTSNIGKYTFSNYLYNSKYTKLNLENTIKITENIIPLLKKSSGGTIINISSIYGFLAFDKNLYYETKINTPVAYGVSKAALIHYSQLMSSKLGPKIRVNTISPGGILRGQPKKFLKKYISKTHLKRMGTEEDVANAVLFLGSDFSSYITGHNLIVDGGYSLS
jgi:NAD(P)-dependent dehydrogenase (short-subunit alcohol dehydrogenase family)